MRDATSGSVQGLCKAIEQSMKDEAKTRIEQLCGEAIKDAAVKIQAEMLTMLNESISVMIVHRADFPGIEITIAFRELPKQSF